MIGAFLKLNFRYIFTPAFPEQIWVVFYNFSPSPPQTIHFIVPLYVAFNAYLPLSFSTKPLIIRPPKFINSY